MKRRDSLGRTLRSGETQLKSGAYTYRKTKNGKKIIDIYARTLEDLRDKEAGLKLEAAQGVDIVASKGLTLNDAFYKYVKDRTDVRYATAKQREGLFRNHIKNSIGRRKLKDIRYSDIVAFYLDLLLDKDLSAGTIDAIQGLLSLIYKAAMRDRLVIYNPVTGASAEAKKKAHKKPNKRHALTEIEQATFTDFVLHDPIYSYWGDMIVFMFGTGCRIGEAGALTWNDVDFQNNEIHIDKTLGRKNKGYYINPAKTETGIRSIPMFEQVRQALENKQTYQSENGKTAFEIDGYHDFVFSTQHGNPVSAETFDQLLKRAIRDCNYTERERAKKERRDPVIIRHFSAHSIRHTFASRLCQNETDLKFIQSIMGHASIKTTLNIYAEVSDERKRDKVNELEGKLQITTERPTKKTQRKDFKVIHKSLHKFYTNSQKITQNCITDRNERKQLKPAKTLTLDII